VLKLSAEALVAILMYHLGFRIDRLSVPGVGSIQLGNWGILITIFWFWLMMNAINLIDGLDGLAAGVAAISALTILVITFDPERSFEIFLALMVIGLSLGFLPHNFHPARLFMGDAGSYLVGYLLAMATLTATFVFADSEQPRHHAILAPLCVLAVPIYDTLTVILIRLRAGRSPFVGDRSHFSHRLVELGMTKGQAVLTIYLATATCGLGALLLHQVKASGAWIILLLVGCILVLVGILETAGRGERPNRRNEDRHGQT